MTEFPSAAEAGLTDAYGVVVAALQHAPNRAEAERALAVLTEAVTRGRQVEQTALVLVQRLDEDDQGYGGRSALSEQALDDLRSALS